MSELRGFLAELRAAGRHDSEGSFTVDLEAQRAKLERYRLPSANHFILPLLSAAVCSNANHFEVTPQGSNLRVHFDGLPFRRQELEKLDYYLFQTSPESQRFRELAVALHASRALGGQAVELLSFRDGEGVFLYFDKRGVKVEDLPAEPPFKDRRVTEMTIRFRSPLTRLLGAARGKTERQLLERFGRFAPLRLFFGPDLLSVDRVRGWPLAAQFQGKARLNPNIRAAKTDLAPIETSYDWSGYLGFDFQTGGLVLISSGLRFQLPPPAAYPLANGVLWVEGLEKDLSALQLLQDRHLEEVLESVSAELDALVERAVSRGPIGPDHMQVLLRACARAAVLRHSSLGRALGPGLRAFPCFERDGAPPESPDQLAARQSAPPSALD